jgi:hypothetical protein
MATSHTSGRADFFQRIPRRSLLVLHLAVFFIFAPVGMLFVSSFAQQRPLASVVLYMTVSGLVAVCWAATFTISKLFISGIVIFSAALMVLPGPLASTTFGLRSAQVSLVCYMLAAATVLGYFLFIAFIGGQARTTLRLMTEMSLARQIHDALVPTIDVTSDQFEVLGTSIPSTEMGGDLIDLIEHEEGTDMFLADVSGHGVRAGVVMGMVKSAIHTQSLRRQGLGELTRQLNNVIEQLTSAELYATMACLRFVSGTSEVEWAVAGHHHITHYRGVSGKVQRLGGPSFPVGLLPDRDYKTSATRVESGDLLVVYTDGLNETTDSSDVELGHDAIEREIARLANRPLREIQAAVFALARNHGPQVDDMTILLVRPR